PLVQVTRVASLDELQAPMVQRMIERSELERASRWTPLTRESSRPPAGLVELGELCRVHRGQVTGNNRVWIQDDDSLELPPRLLLPTVTKARELFAAGVELTDTSRLKRVLDLPTDLDILPLAERRAVE